MSDSTMTLSASETRSRRDRVVRSIVTLLAVLTLLAAYKWTGLSDIVNSDNLRELKFSLWAPVLIILAMTIAGACALPASPFLFITPLLFPPHWSALITTAGYALGATIGYLVARFLGGTWVDKFRDGRLPRFLKRHSSFMVLIAIRLPPSTPHLFINYGAGLAEIPILRFVLATTLAMALKSYVYAEAVHNTVGAKTPFDALTPKTMLSLLAVALLALAGHIIHRLYLKAAITAST